jgi:dimethylaniline monooxygenase (N-oxide forming)
MSQQATNRSSSHPRRLAIIGGGSSGLITLKTALELLPEWEIVCFEKSDRVTGCWGNPYPGFVSTSTKYTTQFSCFAPYSAEIHSDGGSSRAEFFRDDEYGNYLEQFAAAFDLKRYIRLHRRVDRISRDASGSGWQVISQPAARQGANEPPAEPATCEHFDAVVICTGLAAEAKPIESPLPQISLSELNRPDGIANIKHQCIVVFGGGESAVDYANRLSQPELNNRVYLSLRTGIRVSPRYHPIRGVPSDFLRNRLMLSIHPSLRNWIGQRFVEARILHEERFKKWFPAHDEALAAAAGDSNTAAIKKQWAYRLTRAAKDDLFNMFHNKSDDFLDAVAAGRIEIIGPPGDANFQTYLQIDGDGMIQIEPDHLAGDRLPLDADRHHGRGDSVKRFLHGLLPSSLSGSLFGWIRASDHRQHSDDQRGAGDVRLQHAQRTTPAAAENCTTQSSLAAG